MTSTSPSGPTLVERLGIGPGDRVALLHAPDGIEGVLGALPVGVTVRHGLRRTDAVEVIVGFVTEQAHLARNLGWLVTTLVPGGAFWVAWPRPGSPIGTDLSEDSIRAIARLAGWDGTEVRAIDDTWSGLRVLAVEDPAAGC